MRGALINLGPDSRWHPTPRALVFSSSGDAFHPVQFEDLRRRINEDALITMAVDGELHDEHLQHQVLLHALQL